MRICSLLLLLFLFFLVQGLKSQVIKLNGRGEGYNGTELKIYLQSDPVSKRLKPVTRAVCNDKGSFSAEIPWNGEDILFIRTGIYQFYLYVNSSSGFNIRMPAYEARSADEEQSPFFPETRLIPEVLDDSLNINNLIRYFDTEYDPLFNRIAGRVMYNVKRSEIPLLIEQLNQYSARYTDDYYRDFVKFRMIMLNAVAMGEYPGRKEDSVMINSGFLHGNQAYLDLVEYLFTGYFRDLSSGSLRPSFDAAISSSALEELKSVIRNDGKISGEELAEYVIILNLFPEYYTGSIPGEKILALLTELKDSGSTAYIKKLAAAIRGELLSLAQGSISPAVSLMDENGKGISTGDLSGKYLLLSFARSDDPASLAEYGILRSWHSKYSSEFQVVTILTDRNYQAAVRRMRSLGFDWILLDGSHADMEEYMYDVRMYPAFTLIDRSGKIALRNCPFPSENLEATIKKKISE